MLSGDFANTTEGKVVGVVGDYEPTLQNHDSYVNIMPEPEPTCPGNFDGTGEINVADLGIPLKSLGN